MENPIEKPESLIAQRDDGRLWFAVQARTNHEKQVADFFGYQEYEWFLPLYTCRRRWSDRVKKLELPLFPGYVFCRFSPTDRGPILMTPNVIRIAGIGKIPTAIDPVEIAAMQRVMKSGLGAYPHPYLQVGQRVRIDGGSLDGLEGIIEDVRQRRRLIIAVTLLQRSIAVEIDIASVIPVSTPGFQAPPAEPTPPQAGKIIVPAA